MDDYVFSIKDSNPLLLRSNIMGELDKYSHVERATGTANMGKGSEKISSTVKSGPDHTVHETKNTGCGKGHTTFHNDGSMHQHDSHTEKGYGDSWIDKK